METTENLSKIEILDKASNLVKYAPEIILKLSNLKSNIKNQVLDIEKEYGYGVKINCNDGNIFFSVDISFINDTPDFIII
jgi:hypothetical protein